MPNAPGAPLFIRVDGEVTTDKDTPTDPTVAFTTDLSG